MVEGAMAEIDDEICGRGILFNAYVGVQRGTEIRLSNFEDDINPLYISIPLYLQRVRR